MNFDKIFTPRNQDKTLKTPEEQLGEFFDNNKGFKLKQELSPERYEEERTEFIADGLEQEESNRLLEDKIQTIKKQSVTIEEMKEKIEGLKVEAKRLGMDLDFLGPMSEQALFEARFDPVTGLKNRRELYKKTAPQIKELFGIKPDTKPNDEKWLEIIKNEEKTFEDVDLHIMMSDISFLGLVNDLVGHNSGDELLKNISNKMKASVGECFRHGGDEITGTFNLPMDDLRNMAQKAQQRINSIDNLPGLESSKLKPNIDIGFANFSEALKIYKELLSFNSEHKEMDKDVLRNLQNVWLAIADKRTSINKAKNRIPILVDRFDNDREISGALTKAAYGISLEEIKDFSNKHNAGINIDEEIDEFIKRKEIVKLDEAALKEKKLIELVLRQVGTL